MSQTAEDYAGLAKDAYKDRREWVQRPDKGISINGHLYKVVDAQDSPSGFQATAYRAVDPPRGIVTAPSGALPAMRTPAAVSATQADTIKTASQHVI